MTRLVSAFHNTRVLPRHPKRARSSGGLVDVAGDFAEDFAVGLPLLDLLFVEGTTFHFLVIFAGGVKGLSCLPDFLEEP